MNLWLERNFTSSEKLQHTSFKPIFISKTTLDSLETIEDIRWERKKYTSYLSRKIKNEHFIIINTKADTANFYLTIDPVFHFEYGIESTRRPHTNTRGVIIIGGIGKDVLFVSTFIENQSFFQSYLNDYINTNQVVPGQGRVKTFKEGGFDYAMSSGFISYTPSAHVNFQFGHGKHFVGDGYRSLLLSDNAFNYPYLKITSLFANGKIQYTNLYASLQSLNRIHSPVISDSIYGKIPETIFERKGGSFHYFSWAPHKRIEISLFEGIVWQKRDSTGNLPFDYNYLNPLIMVNTLSKGWNDNNALVGCNLKFNIAKRLTIYSQLVLDEPKQKKYGYQIGCKTFDLFGLKNFNVQTEYNNVMPYTYGHQLPLQNYSHYNQALAHPIGANFKEGVAILDYRWKDLFLQIKTIYTQYEDDEGKYHWGKDIFKSDKNKTVVNIVHAKTTLTYMNYEVGYIVNPKTNMNIVVGLTTRNEQLINSITSYSSYLYISFKTSLANYYYDF